MNCLRHFSPEELNSLWKPVGKSVTDSCSRSNTNFERLNNSLKENERDGVDLDSNGLDYCVRKEGRENSMVFDRL